MVVGSKSNPGSQPTFPSIQRLRVASGACAGRRPEPRGKHSNSALARVDPALACARSFAGARSPGSSPPRPLRLSFSDARRTSSISRHFIGWCSYRARSCRSLMATGSPSGGIHDDTRRHRPLFIGPGGSLEPVSRSVVVVAGKRHLDVEFRRPFFGPGAAAPAVRAVRATTRAFARRGGRGGALGPCGLLAHAAHSDPPDWILFLLRSAT